MEKICGVLERVGSLTGGQMITPKDQYGRTKAVGHVRVATQIESLQIGNTILAKARCSNDLFSSLSPGRPACLYIFRHFWRTPVLLGVKYTDDNSKHMVSAAYVRGTCLQYFIVWPLLLAIPGAIVGMVLGGMLGLGNSDFPPVFGMMAGVGVAWWNAVRMWNDNKTAVAD